MGGDLHHDESTEKSAFHIKLRNKKNMDMKNILIVEDDKVLIEMMKFMLKDEKYTIISAENGWKALEIIEKGNIDLIMTDIMMPELSGFDLLSILKRYYLHKIPTIVISSLEKAGLIAPAFRLGANSVIHKPIDYTLLAERIREVMDKNIVIN